MNQGCPQILHHLSARRFSKLFALLCACWFWITPAYAQSTTSVDTRTVLIDALSLTKITDMDFGILFVTAGGTVVMSTDPVPTCVPSAGIIHSDVCQPATFAGLGRAGQRVRVRRPVGRTITLTGPGADMTITDVTIDGGTTLNPVRSNPNWERFTIATADGTFLFRVGGTLNVNANQTPGLYEGNFDIRINYQ